MMAASTRSSAQGASTHFPRVLGAVNALAYAVSFLESAGYGPFSSSFSPGQDNGSVSARYQTIITPNGAAFSIWAPIFLGEALCIVLQCFSERVQTHPLLVSGVSWWFVEVCLAQTAWSPAFAYEDMVLSAAFMACILVGLVAIAVRQYGVVTKTLEMGSAIPRRDYWLLQFPFELHLSWIIAAFTLSANIIVVGRGGDAGTQITAAIASLIALTILSLVALCGLERPQYTLPSVVVWATFWMSFELRNPKSLVAETFTDQTIRSFFLLTSSLSGILALITVLRWVHSHHVSKRNAYSTVDNGASGEYKLDNGCD